MRIKVFLIWDLLSIWRFIRARTRSEPCLLMFFSCLWSGVYHLRGCFMVYSGFFTSLFCDSFIFRYGLFRPFLSCVFLVFLPSFVSFLAVVFSWFLSLIQWIHVFTCIFFHVSFCCLCEHPFYPFSLHYACFIYVSSISFHAFFILIEYHQMIQTRIKLSQFISAWFQEWQKLKQGLLLPKVQLLPTFL